MLQLAVAVWRRGLSGICLNPFQHTHSCSMPAQPMQIYQLRPFMRRAKQESRRVAELLLVAGTRGRSCDRVPAPGQPPECAMTMQSQSSTFFATWTVGCSVKPGSCTAHPLQRPTPTCPPRSSQLPPEMAVEELVAEASNMVRPCTPTRPEGCGMAWCGRRGPCHLQAQRAVWAQCMRPLLPSLPLPPSCPPQDDKEEDKEAAKLRKMQQKAEAAAAHEAAAAQKRAAAAAAAAAAGGQGGRLFGRSKVAPDTGESCLWWGQVRAGILLQTPGGVPAVSCPQPSTAPHRLPYTRWPTARRPTCPAFPTGGKAGGGALHIVVRSGSKDKEGECVGWGV